VLRCKERDSNGRCNSIPSCSLPVTFFVGHCLPFSTLFAAHFDPWAAVPFEILSSLAPFRPPCPQNAHHHHYSCYRPKRFLYFYKLLLFVLCWPPSRYIRVKKTNLIHNLSSVYFVKHLMTDCFTGQDKRQSSKKNIKYQLLYT